MDINGKKLINNLSEDYCSFEVSKLLKEKGFEWYYNDSDPENEYGDGKHSYFTHRQSGKSHAISHLYADTNQNIQQYTDLKLPAPTHSLAIKWVRENFGIHVCGCMFSITTKKYSWEIWDDKKEKVYSYKDNSDEWDINTPEESTEAALLYTLQNLIP